MESLRKGLNKILNAMTGICFLAMVVFTFAQVIQQSADMVGRTCFIPVCLGIALRCLLGDGGARSYEYTVAWTIPLE